MACRSCRCSLDLIPRHAKSIGRTGVRRAWLVSSSPYRPSRHLSGSSRRPADPKPATPPPESGGVLVGAATKVGRAIAPGLAGVAPRLANAYQVFDAAGKIYKACSSHAAYAIPEESRRDGTMKTTEDGEEIGVGGGVWHDGTSGRALCALHTHTLRRPRLTAI